MKKKKIEESFNLIVYDLVIDKEQKVRFQAKCIANYQNREVIIIATGLKKDRRAASMVYVIETKELIIVPTSELKIKDLACSEDDFAKAIQIADTQISKKKEKI